MVEADWGKDIKGLVFLLPPFILALVLFVVRSFGEGRVQDRL